LKPAIYNANPKIESFKNDFDEKKSFAQAWINQIEQDIRIEHARLFTFYVVKSYWSLVYFGTQFELPKVENSFEELQLQDEIIELAKSLAQYPSKLDFVEASFQIGDIYTSLLPEEYRSSHGIFYTSPELAYRIIQMAEEAGIDWINSRILDPACGGGAFLAPIALKIAAQLKTQNPEVILTHIENNLVGYEIDTFSAWLSQTFLEVALNKICKIENRKVKSIIKVCNTLEQLPSNEKFDLIIGNPPFGKINLSDELRKTYQNSLYGHANLYGLFIHFGASHLNENGVLAYITPTSFLSGEYFKNLRMLIRETCAPLEFNFVQFRKGMFQGVLQETMLSTYKKNKRKKNPVQISELKKDFNNKINTVTIGDYFLPEDKKAAWLLPRTIQQAQVINKIKDLRDRLIDWGYTVKTGPLVWNRHKKQLTNKSQENAYPLIWSEAISSNGKFNWKADKQNHKLYCKIRSAKDNWLFSKEPCILLQRTTAKEQTRRLISTILPSSFLRKHRFVIIENHVNIIKAAKNSPPVSLITLNVLLNSHAMDIIFRCISGSVAVSAYELEHLPLPPVEKLQYLENLIIKNASIETIESECYNIYDLNDVRITEPFTAQRDIKTASAHIS
jgi:adenine-specific DNA-methyltransferase